MIPLQFMVDLEISDVLASEWDLRTLKHAGICSDSPNPFIVFPYLPVSWKYFTDRGKYITTVILQARSQVL